MFAFSTFRWYDAGCRTSVCTWRLSSTVIVKAMTYFTCRCRGPVIIWCLDDSIGVYLQEGPPRVATLYKLRHTYCACEAALHFSSFDTVGCGIWQLGICYLSFHAACAQQIGFGSCGLAEGSASEPGGQILCGENVRRALANHGSEGRSFRFMVES